MIEITHFSKWSIQPCHFGEYGRILFWEDGYNATEIAEQLYAMIMELV